MSWLEGALRTLALFGVLPAYALLGQFADRRAGKIWTVVGVIAGAALLTSAAVTPSAKPPSLAAKQLAIELSAVILLISGGRLAGLFFRHARLGTMIRKGAGLHRSVFRLAGIVCWFAAVVVAVLAPLRINEPRITKFDVAIGGAFDVVPQLALLLLGLDLMLLFGRVEMRERGFFQSGSAIRWNRIEAYSWAADHLGILGHFLWSRRDALPSALDIGVERNPENQALLAQLLPGKGPVT